MFGFGGVAGSGRLEVLQGSVNVAPLEGLMSQSMRAVGAGESPASHSAAASL